MAANEARDGIALTHLDEPLHDDTDVTKRELLDYLDAMSDRLVPVLADRPLSVIRVRPGSASFMQKNLPTYAPDWIRRSSSWAQRSKRTVTYPVCDDRRTLLWLANQRAVEFHPTLFRLADDTRPTHLVLDIDPPLDSDFGVVVAAAQLVRQALADVGLDGAVKTSGAKGVHVFVPLASAGANEAAAASRAIAVRAERLDPDLATTAFVRDEREGKVFLDSTRAGGATVAAAYSPRIRPGLPVSFPVAWVDLAEVDPLAFTIRTVPDLLGDSDPWVTLLPAPQELPQALLDEGQAIPVARVQAMHAGKRRKRAQRSDGPPPD
ncbi:DNA polymerase domain-containing protein [uncultured Jatrophihabitans sp.]|uniref:DNA polymerase domain-containing protein n=1 Tax=uncultured Jatrophihabitans sp. TaxID=1610747 RepID=UPI0035C9C4F8